MRRSKYDLSQRFRVLKQRNLLFCTSETANCSTKEGLLFNGTSLDDFQPRVFNCLHVYLEFPVTRLTSATKSPPTI